MLVFSETQPQYFQVNIYLEHLIRLRYCTTKQTEPEVNIEYWNSGTTRGKERQHQKEVVCFSLAESQIFM